ncbi:MAG: hypothetical protein QW341_03615 [Candidatus Bathyarchaeia archaeon]
MCTFANIKSKTLGCRVTPEIYDIFQRIAQAQGITAGKYLRQLILNELARLSILSSRISKIKEVVE